MAPRRLAPWYWYSHSPGGVDAGDVGPLGEIHPEAAHGVVHAGKDLHGNIAGIVADELFVNFQDAFELAIENLAVDVGEVEIDHRLAVDAEVVLVHHFVDGAGGDIARHQVAVFWIPLFEKVPPFFFRDRLRVAFVAGGSGDPDASAFSAGGFGHQAQLVFAGDAGGMHLNELAVGVIAALLVEGRLRRTGAHDRIGGAAENGAVAAGGDDDGVGGEGADFHGAQVHGTNAATDSVGVEHGGEKFPVLEFTNLAFGFVAAHLLIERVEQLLTGGGAGEGGAIEERAAEAAEIEQSFGGAIEGHAHAVEQINDAGGGFAHGLDRGLVGQEVSTVNGVVEMLPGGIALALQILGGVDAALGAYRVRALYRHDGEQVNMSAHLGDLDDGGKARQAAADHYDFRIRCHLVWISCFTDHNCLTTEDTEDTEETCFLFNLIRASFRIPDFAPA